MIASADPAMPSAGGGARPRASGVAHWALPRYDPLSFTLDRLAA
jgi:hypothetical protein